ncbi:MAG: hypothetical protein PW843_03225 [Azospirillaceae bacterium]|nr:hypothetical protein [Azospirillaceae bacterium]
MSGRVSQRRSPLTGGTDPGATPAGSGAPAFPQCLLRVAVGGVPVMAAVTDIWPWPLLSLSRYRQVDMVPVLHRVGTDVAIAADAWIALDGNAEGNGTAAADRGIRVRLYLVDVLPVHVGGADLAQGNNGVGMLISRHLVARLGGLSC